MEEILKIANKIIRSNVSRLSLCDIKNNQILFLSHFIGMEFEIFIKPAMSSKDFIKYCSIKGIRFGILIIQYKSIKDFNNIMERAKKFYKYVKTYGIEIKEFFILRRNIYRNITGDFTEDKDQ